MSAPLALVTGGAGYFGSALVARLLAAGQRVRVFDINEPTGGPGGVEVIRGDIRDGAAVARACAGVAAIYHCVAQVPLAKDRDLFWSVNRDGTRTLLEGALAQGVGKVVYVSSSAVFGAPDRNPVDERTVPRPGEEYGRAKLAGEALCHEYVGRGLSVTIIRPRTIMGHGRLGIMQILFEWVRQGRYIPVLGRGDNLYQFVHADDLAEACIRAAALPSSEVFNIGAARFGTMRETLEALIRHAGTASRVVSVPALPAELLMRATSKVGLSPLGPYHALMYGKSMYFDLDRARRLLDWTPRFSNEEMFCQSYDWYLANRDEVLQRSGSSPHASAVRQGILAVVSHALSLAALDPRRRGDGRGAGD